MNKGITLAKGDWLYFMGAGDLLFDHNVLTDISRNFKLEKVNLISGNIIYQGATKPFVYSKNKIVKKPRWSFKMWVWNGLHHQGTFYKRTLFSNTKYALEFKVLSDYHFNLKLYKEKEKCEIVDLVLAKCNSDGLSKSGKWNLYKEEINIKSTISSSFYMPFFYIIAFIKYISRKILNG